MIREKVAAATISVLLLAGAVFSGASVYQRVQIDTFSHVEALGSGFDRLKHFIASALYLQLDDYHHIEMYQGIPWNQVTDYLPQMWLIAKLDPGFTDVYCDAAYHLAVNLDHIEEGMDFMKEGVFRNPQSLDIRYEYAYLLWQTGTGSSREITSQCMAYRSILRRSNGDADQPYNEPASTSILSEVFEAETDSTDVYTAFYRDRAQFVRSAMRSGLYYPDYLAEPPVFLRRSETESGQ